MFEATRMFAFFDYFRVPYRVRAAPAAGRASALPAGIGRVSRAGPGEGPRGALFWLVADMHGRPGLPGCRLGTYRLENSTFTGQVATDEAVAPVLAHLGSGWQEASLILDAGGNRCAALWQDGDGSVFLPFDPGEVMLRFWSESYRGAGRAGLPAITRAAAVRGYYLVRPVLPRALQIGMRRAFTRIQGRSAFPAWPVEDSLHDLYERLFGLLAGLAGQPVPFLEPWPGGRSWALVLTHDVETQDGYADIGRLRDIERERGLRSSWNFVAHRYHVGDDVVRALQAEGFEVGVHGLRHDGRDLASRRLLNKRLPAMRDYARQWDAAGFRSPATQRDWELMPLLGFDYDSSYTDTDPYEPQPGGCCTYLPYLNDGMVELPITLPQDHTLFEVLRQPDGDVWLSKARHVRARHGMVLVLTHPDYARDNPRITESYRRLLDEVGGDDTAWRALPRDVAAWWRRRAASSLRWNGGSWVVEGPACAEGRVGFASPDPGPVTAAAAAAAAGRARAAVRLRTSPGQVPPRPSGSGAGHVLLVIENLPLGVDQRVRKQVSALLDDGFLVSVVTRSGPENAVYRGVPGLTVLEYPPPAEPGSMPGYAREYALSFVWAALRCGAARLRGPVDVAQFGLPPDIYFPLARLLRWLGVTVVADYRDLMPELFAARYADPRPEILSALRWLERRTQRVADHTICTNGYFRDRLIASGADPRQVTIVGNGPVLARVQQAAASRDLRGGHKFLCCWTGWIGRQDRVDLLMEAIGYFVHGLGRTDCGFAILGGGECLDEVKAAASRLGLQPWVTFTGWLPEEKQVFSYLASADIGLDTGLQADISPVKIFEYMAFGLPVVAFDLQETRVMTGGSGALVPPADVQAYARELAALLDDGPRRARLGEIGRRRVRAELSWERQAAVYVGVMRRLCADPAARPRGRPARRPGGR